MDTFLRGKINWAPLIFIFLFFSCAEVPSIDISEAAIIPLPRNVKATNSSFELTAETNLNLVSVDKDLSGIADYFNDYIEAATGFRLETRTISSPAKGINFLVFDEEGWEANYELEIDKDKVVISADSTNGLFYGIQTLLQLLPDEIEADEIQDVKWLVGTGYITDGARYEYRGSMLDVARHFFSVEDVKKYIDYLAAYKMNKLHLHLSDDQGWRIEIKSWPKLTEIGGSTEVGGGEGGFYTQEEYNDIVAYAADRFITIIPEIDMPGHTNAALASYPELNCDNKARELYTGTEVGFSTLCTEKEVVYQFIDDVVRELVEMTPGEYIHIGGDESHVTPLEDYIPFMERVQEIVEKYGKKVMAWDEIAHAQLKENTIAQFWASEENAKKAVLQGAKVLMSPAKKIYLDMQYDSTTQWGLHWAAYIEVDSSYIWDPATYAKGIGEDNIIGVEAPLWSETISEIPQIEYLIFPRIIGVAEIAWTRQKDRNWDEYKVRLGKHSSRLDAKGINYYKSPKVDWGNNNDAAE